MSNQTKITVNIEKISFEGKGIARHEGKVFFVEWAVPGDIVAVEIEKDFGTYANARLVDFLEKSSDRVDPPCPYFFKCGGCQLQNLNYDAQLKWKQIILEDALKKREIATEVLPILPSPLEWNYRNRIQLHRSPQNQWGFHKPGSHEVVPIENCLIAEEGINEQIKQLKIHPLVGAIHELPLREIRALEGSSFSQINTAQNKNLVGQVMKWANPSKKDIVFDLFAGSGNFSFPLARESKQVFAIERDAEGVAVGIKQAEKKNIFNIQWIESSVSRALVDLKKRGVVPQILVMDPPRKGLEEALPAILPFKAECLIYVSCNPDSFASDSKELLKAGYTLKQVQPLDMFPQTAHVEVVGLFSLV